MAFGKCAVRTVVIAGLVGGAAVVIAGPERIGALFSQTRGQIHGAIDRAIEDPVALRAQLRSLEAQYPNRIAEIRGDLAELRQQNSQLRRDLAVSQRVIELADADLEKVQGLVARAEAAATFGTGQIVRVVFANETMDVPTAQAKAARINQVRSAYITRVADIQRDLGYLGQQDARLDGVLSQLEAEHAEFQTQLWNMDRQVDAIARNDRLIDLMKKREATIAEHSRYRVASLDQLETRFADIRARQEAELESMARAGSTSDYEGRAKVELDREMISEPAMEPTEPGVIEIGPEPTTTPATRVRAVPVKHSS